MRDLTFNVAPFTLPMIEVGQRQGPAQYEASKVGYGLFQLWNQFQAQLKGMADPEMIGAIDRAAKKYLAGNSTEAQYKQAVAQAVAVSKDVPEPGVDRRELIAALRSIKENMKNTGLDPQTRMELVGYAQALIDGLSKSTNNTAQVGQMTSWLLVGLGFKGEGL